MATVTTTILPLLPDSSEAFQGLPHPRLALMRLRMYGFTQSWDPSGHQDIWLWAKAELSHVCRLVIADVSEDDAHHIRAQWRSAEQFVWERDPSSARLREVVQQITERVHEANSEQNNRNNFLALLTDVSNQFAHLDGGVVQIDGTFSRASNQLSADDVELLKQVWLRLPLKYQSWRKLTQRLRVKSPRDEVCPTCGNDPATAKARRISGAKTRGELRKRLGKLNEAYPAEVFNAWTRARLRPGEFTTATELYDDYRKWAAKHGNNMNERRMSKETLLSLNKWGRMMVAGQHVPHRRNTGKGYRIALRHA